MSERSGVRRFEVSGSVAVLGDIHGCADLLGALLRLLPRDCAVVSVGDVCDRGPDTRGAVDLLLERSAVGVQGNHEQWWLDWLEHGKAEHIAEGLAMLGEPTLRSYGIRGTRTWELAPQQERVPEAHRAWFQALTPAMDLVVDGQPYWVCHAGISPFLELEGRRAEEVVPHLARFSPDMLLWPKFHPRYGVPVDRPVIQGHVPLRRPEDHGFAISVDTGAGRPGGTLSAVILPERRFVTVGP